MDKARETPDFGDDEYPNMVCVEAGHVSSPVLLLPGTAFEASQILQVIVNPKRWNSKKAQPQPQPPQNPQPQNPHLQPFVNPFVR